MTAQAVGRADTASSTSPRGTIASTQQNTKMTRPPRAVMWPLVFRERRWNSGNFRQRKQPEGVALAIKRGGGDGKG